MLDIKKILNTILIITLSTSISGAQDYNKKAPDDLHIHLNGSYSLEFLKSTAHKNKLLNKYRTFVDLHQKMKDGHAQKNSDKNISIIWQKFSLIHDIIQSLEDVREGTKDLVIKHPSPYLEIRTTPKNISGRSKEDYVKAFIQGLKDGNKLAKSAKAVGILSIDRTKHSLKEAMEIIHLAKKHKALGEPIVGIDISGNPYAKKRSISGETLKTVLETVLESPLGIGIHFAESNHALEKADSDIVLSVLTTWKHKKLKNKTTENKEFFFGKVRLGHVIFPTDSQIKIIQKLNLPIELCPTCHKSIGWWKVPQTHPIKSIYANIDAPIVLGTDDTIIFDSNIIAEQNYMNEIYNLDPHHTVNSEKFRFS